MQEDKIDNFHDDNIATMENALLTLRPQVLKEIEILRKDKIIGASLEAELHLPKSTYYHPKINWQEIAIVSQVHYDDNDKIRVTQAKGHKCPRCWRIEPKVNDDGLCPRCESACS